MKRDLLHRKGRDVCPVCRKALKTCYCALIKPFETGPVFVILQHPREVKKSIGTGRMTHLCISNSLLFEGVDFSEDKRVNSLIEDAENFPAVLYPGEKATEIDGEKGMGFSEIFPKGKRLVIFVIDGTWSMAKKMMKLSRNLHEIPRLSFRPSHKSRYRIRFQPKEVCLSTVESVHRVIDIFDSTGIFRVRPERAHDILMEVFTKTVDRQIDFINDPKGVGYRKGHVKKESERKPAKKWEKRSLFFRG